MDNKQYKELQLKVIKNLINSYEAFYYFAFPLLEPNTKILKNWHIKVIAKELERECIRINKNEPKEKDIIFNIPPRSSKSYLTSIIYPVWCWLRNPALKIAIVSYSRELSESILMNCRNLIRNEKFQELFGSRFKLTEDKNRVKTFANDKTGFMLSSSPEGVLTGYGFDIMIFDDIQKPSESESKSARDKVINWYSKSAYNRINNENIGLRIIVQQRLHKEDLTGYLISNYKDNYKLVRIPAELDDEVAEEYRQYYEDGLFWKERFPLSMLREYSKYGKKYYAGQYLQNPYDSDGGVFKKEYFQYYNEKDTESIRHFFVDTATSEKTRNDATAILCCYEKNNNLYIEKVVTVRLEYPEMLQYLKKFVNDNRYTNNSKIYIEKKSTGEALIPDLKKNTNLNIVELKSKGSKIERANMAAVKFESKRVFFKYENKDYEDELLAFPYVKHDDQVDVTSYAIIKLLVDKTKVTVNYF